MRISHESKTSAKVRDGVRWRNRAAGSPSETTTTYLRCHEINSGSESFLEGARIYETDTIWGEDDTIYEIDINSHVLTTYQINDYVLPRYPLTKIGKDNPHKTAHGGVVQIKARRCYNGINE